MAVPKLESKRPSPRNQTMRLSNDDRRRLQPQLLDLRTPATGRTIKNRIIHGNVADVVPLLPDHCADLLILDPPYNLARTYGATAFAARPVHEYAECFRAWFEPLLRLLKPEASLYVCCDWRTSGVVQAILAEHVRVRNRITWEREKGRGAAANWKNSSEDIWFCTMGRRFSFNVDQVKLKRRVIAPYRNADGQPRDWKASRAGDFRLTHPSNLWTDLTVPFWSMPENTEHPTQKPEKLVARLLLASTNPGDVVLDPFLGSGTTASTAAKLGRNFIGIEREREYCLLGLRRLEIARSNASIQGYEDGVFWERNSRPSPADRSC